MPESLCVHCGTKTSHTDDDENPECEECHERLMWQQIIIDIATGKIEVTFDDEGRPIVPGVDNSVLGTSSLESSLEL